jgi:hypothetical protein
MMDITDVEWEIVDYGEVVLDFKCNHEYVYTFKYLDIYFFVTLVGAVMTHEGIRQWAP